ncbi:hypothetical protein [Janthinobacterium sp. J1-1]|uniref:hypothetical protein n=1 Tax=Janthinobacterium sp. J1-1 TaxID=3065910 RepID=UPI0028117660|nr:hypothetical protein [Janthinobacterium sp. J1-1]
MITDRLLEIIEAETQQRNRFKTLEDATGIAKDSWTAVWHRRQRPTAEMIEAIAKLWPDYAFWLACGDTEPERGHVAPITTAVSYPIVNGVPQHWASAERIYKQKLLDKVPVEPVEKALRDKKIRDEVFKVRERQVMPAVQLCYERIMRALGQESRDELFLLEYDKELRNIRLERWKAELKLQKSIYIERTHLGESVQVEEVLDKLLSMINLRKK